MPVPPAQQTGGAPPPLRIGFVGAGSMGQAAHLRNYALLPDCNIVALAEPRRETARQVARRYGIPRVYPDHRALLDHETVDGLVVVQPFQHHAAILPEIYGRTPCLFTEKPLARSVEAAERLVARARETGTVHMVGYHKRCDPAAQFTKQTLDQWRAEGSHGRLTYLRILMPPGDWIAAGFRSLIDAGDPRPPMRLEPPPAGLPAGAADEYETLVNYYVHQVNFLRFLLGEPLEVAWAEPTGVVMGLQSASGIPAVIEMAPYQTTRAWDERILVAFQHGTIRLHLPAPLAVNRCGQVEIYTDRPGTPPPKTIIPTLPWEDAMSRQAAAFLQVCRGTAQPPCNAAEAVDDLRLLKEYLLRRRAAHP